MPVIVNKSKCPQNHRCPAIKKCPVGALKQTGMSAPIVDNDTCIDCGKCTSFCPMRALVLQKKETSPSMQKGTSKSEVITMNMNRMIRGIAGGVVLVSILLGALVSLNLLWLGGIISASLFQSAFTNWCPMMSILRFFGIKD